MYGIQAKLNFSNTSNTPLQANEFEVQAQQQARGEQIMKVSEDIDEISDIPVTYEVHQIDPTESD